MQQEYKQAAPRKSQEEEDATEPVNLQDDKLSEDVACCLNEIDEALNDSETLSEALAKQALEEKLYTDMANAENDFYANFSSAAMHEAWIMKYAHLGAYVSYCCNPSPEFDPEMATG